MKLVWDEIGKREFETGVSNGVLYPVQSDGTYSKGVAWSGLSAVNESPSGAEPTAIYADNIKYLNLFSAEEYGATIEAYTYPDEFEECDGSAELATGIVIGQQTRKAFGFSYKTVVGNDVNSEAGYKIHLVYGCMASPSEKNHETVNDSPDLSPFSWEITTTPVAVAGHKSTSTLVIDSTKIEAEKLAKIEAALYGSDDETARLPLPDEILTLIA